MREQRSRANKALRFVVARLLTPWPQHAIAAVSGPRGAAVRPGSVTNRAGVPRHIRQVEHGVSTERRLERLGG